MSEEKIELTKETKEWIFRDESTEFYKQAGRLGIWPWWTYYKRMKEIPDEIKREARYVLRLAVEITKQSRENEEIDKNSCLIYRCLLFKIMKKYNLKIPYYWFCDGVMFPPKWLVNMTNGLMTWVCDKSKAECGMEGECIYYGNEKDHQEWLRVTKNDERVRWILTEGVGISILSMIAFGGLIINGTIGVLMVMASGLVGITWLGYRQIKKKKMEKMV